MMKNKKQLIHIADLIGAQFGPSTEVVVHDFTKDLDHTIVHIVNGHVSGRKVGDAATGDFLKYMKSSTEGKDKIRHVIHTPDGKFIRSSTANFYDSDGTLNSSLCINQDITDLVTLESAFKGMADDFYFDSSMSTADEEPIKPPTTSIHSVMDNIIAEGMAMIGTPADKMNKDAKIKLLAFLDDRGVFLIQKSGQKVCELLGISKFTLYNYLEEVRKG